MIEMIVDSVRVGMMNQKSAQHNAPYLLLLKEKTAEKYLPIFISPAETNALAIKMRGERVLRPLTHDLFFSVIEAFGGSINSVVISEFKDNTFFARLILNKDGKQYEYDSRPGDAIALTLVGSNQVVPIYATESVMEKRGITSLKGLRISMVQT